jgi:hypothetical protein
MRNENIDRRSSNRCLLQIDKLQATMAASNDKACARVLIQEDGNDGLAGERTGVPIPGAHQLILPPANEQGPREINLS